MPLNGESKLLKYNVLKASLVYHKYMYYQENRPEITDREYDFLEKSFDVLAEELKLPGSWVGWRDSDLKSLDKK